MSRPHVQSNIHPIFDTLRHSETSLGIYTFDPEYLIVVCIKYQGNHPRTVMTVSQHGILTEWDCVYSKRFNCLLVAINNTRTLYRLGLTLMADPMGYSPVKFWARGEYKMCDPLDTRKIISENKLLPVYDHVRLKRPIILEGLARIKNVQPRAIDKYNPFRWAYLCDYVAFCEKCNDWFCNRFFCAKHDIGNLTKKGYKDEDKIVEQNDQDDW